MVVGAVLSAEGARLSVPASDRHRGGEVGPASGARLHRNSNS